MVKGHKTLGVALQQQILKASPKKTFDDTSGWKVQKEGNRHGKK